MTSVVSQINKYFDLEKEATYSHIKHKTSTMGGGGKGSGKGTWKTNEHNKQDKGRGKKNTRMCVQTDRESVLNRPPP